MTAQYAPERVESVLVPLDGSMFSATALPVAARLAAQLAVEEVRLFSAVPTEDDVPERDRELALVDIPCALLTREVVVDLDPAGAIHEALRRLGPTAVACMASHGKGRSAALMGSVTTQVIARGHDPLVVVGPVVDEKPRGEGVVLCVDDSPVSFAMVPIARRWALLLGESLTVLTVAEPVPPPLDDRPVFRRWGPDGDPMAFLDAMVRPIIEAGEKVETAVIYDPVGPADGIVTFNDERPASIVILSSHVRTGVTRLVMGSVSSNVVHASRSPVLIVPRPDAR
jgi:nucleotide-binding universal stress UspA family protein